MRVVMPYTRLEPWAVKALEGVDVEYTDVSADEFAYWRLLRDLWGAGGPFVVVEHDVIVREDTLAALEGCPAPWCSQAVHMVDTGSGNNWTATLGCARFRPSGPWFVPATPWRTLDTTVGDWLRARGWQVHVHFPILLHLNASVIDYARHTSWLAGQS